VRTFFAADLDVAFLDRAAGLGETLRGSVANARWVAREVMHVTVRFFGASDERQVAALTRFVEELPAGVEPRYATATKVTAFPREQKARVLVVELDDAGFLAGMAELAERLAVDLGYEPETRAYRPHLTLARLRMPQDVREACASSPSLGSARITALTLYESKTLPSGPVYTPLARRTLDGG